MKQRKKKEKGVGAHSLIHGTSRVGKLVGVSR
jgi:hypothetical protein